MTIAYDRNRELLQLEFNSRTLYQYFGVPATVYEGLLQAPSRAAIFNRAIRGKFRYIVNDPAESPEQDVAPALTARPMERTVAALPAGSRITDSISLA